MDECDEIKDLIKRKTKLLKDSQKHVELGDVIFQIGYLYYHKGYYKEALEEFEHALDLRQKMPINLDIATTHRFIGETLCKLGSDFQRAKLELDQYYSITLKINDLVETQRALTTLGNYYMSLAECNYKDKRIDHLNDAYSHYLKSYDILDEISEKKMVDSKEFGLMKARTCLNCAFAMDEKRDIVICTEYLKAAIEICEQNNFYEDLIRCLYIKCDQARRKGKTEECLKVADTIVEITHKTKDFVQQSQDYAYVADLYIKVQNFEKAKYLLKKAYKLKKSCAISSEIIKKLKETKKIIQIESKINQSYSNIREFKENEPSSLELGNIYELHEKLGDSYCNIGLYELGLNSYFKQLNLTQKLNKSNSEIATIYSSIAQTYQDLDNFKDALKFFELELKTHSINDESECKSLLNIALLKEKLQFEFNALKDTYLRAFEKAENSQNLPLQLKVLHLLNETEVAFGNDTSETIEKINSLKNKMDENELQENEDEEENSINESLVFSSDSDDLCSDFNDEERKYSTRLKNQLNQKKTILKRNIRGETQLHVACIKGNYNLAKKLIEGGHPVNERDNLNWLPIHEACNYGHTKIVEILIKNGAKVNDSIGPITPLHDAAQNGHLEVVKLLLDAGALSYVFSKDGYTPLDFLYKFKTENGANFSTVELNLYNEIFEKMVSSIKAKDKNYKIKKVVNTEVDIVVDEPVLDEEKLRTDRHSRSKMLNDLSDFDDDSDESLGKRKGKKKAICEYRKAINSIGSRSNAVSSIPLHGKKVVDDVFVTESDYNLNDEWLINDMAKTSSNKRKYIIHSDDESSGDKRIKKTSNYHEIADDDYDFIMARKNSKKRFVPSNSNDSFHKNLKENFQESSLDKNYETISSINSDDSNKSEDKKVLTDSDESSNIEIDLTKSLPSRATKSQIKLTKMLNYANKSTHKSSDQKLADNFEFNASVRQSKSAPQTWRIKATVDDNNFLIPVSNTNASINELTSQILNRYKIIFSKDPNFREPDKVILKNSDDLILFGDDLIKDVLSDMSQVKILTESYKKTPKLDELYEQLCLDRSTKLYPNIKALLKTSAETGCLNLNNLLYDIHQIPRQFEIIFQAMLVNLKQVGFSEIDLTKNLTALDLSSNYLSDQMLNTFFDNLFFSFKNLKLLNLSCNNLSIKTLKFIYELTASNTLDLMMNSCILESLNISGNDLGQTMSTGLTNSDLVNYLSNLIKLFPKLKQLDISDCKINFEKLSNDQIQRQKDDISIKKFLENFKNCQIIHLNVSYNKLGFQYVSNLCENLPKQAVEYLNLSCCITEKNYCNEIDDFFTKSVQSFLHISLTDILFRNLNLKIDQTSKILYSLSVCKKLACLDLSFNEFDPILMSYVFDVCPNIEKAYLVNNLAKKLEYNSNFTEILNSKIQDSNKKALKVLEIKSTNLFEINEIRSLLKKRWQNSIICVRFISKQIIEFKID